MIIKNNTKRANANFAFAPVFLFAWVISTGYYIKDSAVAGDNDLTLSAKNTSSEKDFSENYNVSVKNSKLTITAPTCASLSYAVQHFANSLTDNADFAEGTNEEKRFTMRHVDATDKELFKYCGMWEANDAENPTAMVSYWNVAYVEICFTGNAITPEFSRETTFKIKMDDDLSYSDYYTANGKMTFFADGDGVHTLRIYTNRHNNHLNIRQQYGNVNVVWTCKMMTENVTSPWLETAIESLGGWENGLYICRLNNDRTGGNGHPSADAHEEASDLLYDFIKENGLI